MLSENLAGLIAWRRYLRLDVPRYAVALLPCHSGIRSPEDEMLFQNVILMEGPAVRTNVGGCVLTGDTSAKEGIDPHYADESEFTPL
jgi:hypothetical protein